MNNWIPVPLNYIEPEQNLIYNSQYGVVSIMPSSYVPDNTSFFVNHGETITERVGTLTIDSIREAGRRAVENGHQMADQYLVNSRTYMQMHEELQQRQYQNGIQWLRTNIDYNFWGDPTEPIKELRKTKGFRKFHK